MAPEAITIGYARSLPAESWVLMGGGYVRDYTNCEPLHSMCTGGSLNMSIARGCHLASILLDC